LPFLYFGDWDVETITPPPRGEGLTIHEPTNQGHSHGLRGNDMREMMIKILPWMSQEVSKRLINGILVGGFNPFEKY